MSKNRVGLSISKSIINTIDKDRGDISRSRYIQRILEKYYLIHETKENKKNNEFSISDSLAATPGLSDILDT
ncbi:MAG: hypothetical protein ACPKPY_07155 [Nitrososphaeraceae archaeon]